MAERNGFLFLIGERDEWVFPSSIDGSCCAGMPNIGDRLSDSGDTGSEIVNVENEGGTTTTVVDSSDYEVWAYLDFESGELVTVGDLNPTWLGRAFSATREAQWGVSGSGDMEVAMSTVWRLMTWMLPQTVFVLIWGL